SRAQARGDQERHAHSAPVGAAQAGRGHHDVRRSRPRHRALIRCMGLRAWLSQPWPWWVAGPLIGSIALALLAVGNKAFGVSSNLRHICAAIAPGGSEYFRYDWKRLGGWNLTFLAGIL